MFLNLYLVGESKLGLIFRGVSYYKKMCYFSMYINLLIFKNCKSVSYILQEDVLFLNYSTQHKRNEEPPDLESKQKNRVHRWRRSLAILKLRATVLSFLLWYSILPSLADE
jgi:hypothetical protein